MINKPSQLKKSEESLVRETSLAMIPTKNTCRLRKNLNRDMGKYRKYPDPSNYLINFNKFAFQVDNICVISQSC